MAELFNIYCDESCHLEHDNIQVMVLGSVWCKAAVARKIGKRIGEIKRRHGIPSGMEIKWTKLSRSKQQLYLDLVDFFFDDDDLHFRGILISDKTELDHSAHNQTHDTWYYKMCFRMIEPIIDPEHRYRVYLDIKDTQSESKRKKLEKVLRNSRRDRHGVIVERVQQIRSHESPIMQLADILIGAIGYHSRRMNGNSAKLEVVRRIQKRSTWSLESSTWLRDSKISLLCWHSQEVDGA